MYERKNGTYSRLAVVDDLSYVDKTAKSGKTYYYKVRGFMYYGHGGGTVKGKNAGYSKYSDKVNNKSHKKIVRSYKDLEKLKKYIKKNYNNPTKYTKKLKKYKKSYFKKNALIFVTENVDMNQLSYKLLKLTKNNDKFVINVEKRDLLKDGYKKIAMVIYGANTYIVEAKKSKLKNVKKVKVTYKFVKNSEK